MKGWIPKLATSMSLAGVFFVACGNDPSENKLASGVQIDQEINVNAEPAASETEPSIERSEYSGTAIDQIFPASFHISLVDENGREESQSVYVDEFKINIVNYVPIAITKNRRSVFRFKNREPGGYWATLIGKSSLLNEKSAELYAVVSGPGGVCCTNYSIVDISSGATRNIYHSEDFGNFRGPMEIFDSNGDGKYELMQFDSCFRYFQGDCGSCSPQPRAYFSYDTDKRKYVPATGIAQDFVREGYELSDTWLVEKLEEYKNTNEISLKMDIRRTALAHMVDLLYIGEEERAWTVFDKYIFDDKTVTKREIKKLLTECKFYQALKRL